MDANIFEFVLEGAGLIRISVRSWKVVKYLTTWLCYGGLAVAHGGSKYGLVKTFSRQSVLDTESTGPDGVPMLSVPI